MRFCRVRTPILLPALLLAASILLVACTSSPSKENETAGPATARGGALLWEQNCARCHNYRSPRERSDAEWAIIVHHMRVRGNLTATEHREILHFLQAAN